MRSINIGYTAFNLQTDEHEKMEAQFDISDDAFDMMFYELWTLFRDYCEECGLRNVDVKYVTEVPYEEE